MVSVLDIAKILKNAKSVALFCHIRPDGDTLGSAIALKLALNKLGIKADVFCDDEVPDRFHFLKGSDLVLNDITDTYEVYGGIDASDAFRLGKFSEVFLKAKNSFCIDHHISNSRYAKVNCVIDKASNAENVLDLINALEVKIDKPIANWLLTGISTDTGNFCHKNVTPDTLISASELLKFGADLNQISFYMFSAQTKERAVLFALVMGKIRYYLNDRLAIAVISSEDLIKSGAKKDETEGFIDFIMGINTVEVGICLMENSKDNYKASFRSKGADVNAVASTFGGGGHILASGAQLQGSLEEVIDKLRYAVSQHLKD